jgi:formamidopyrimidine-DNA glycosylase
MIELPEAIVIAKQIEQTLAGKRIKSAIANYSLHKFAWYSGDPAEYNQKLAGKVIGKGQGVAGMIEFAAGDMLLAIGAPVFLHGAGVKRPEKHQLLLEIEDGTAISSTAQMWGGFFCWRSDEKAGFFDYDHAKELPSPLTEAFTWEYFHTLFNENTPKLSAKAFLATEQRVPGLGNGVLQDILWTARIHPKRKMGELTDDEVRSMFDAVKSVLATMTAQGGRDTERDLFGNPGGYKTILSKNTVDTACPVSGDMIKKEPYLGGAIYYCPGCQEL